MFLGISKYRILASVLAVTAVCEYRLAASTLCVRVNDNAELALPNAWVNVVNLVTNRLHNGRTDEKGRACFSQLPEGLYSVETGLTGFLNVRYYPVRVTYPTRHELTFRLPFGEINEGRLGKEAIVAGTLKQGDNPVEGANICILELDQQTSITCAVTNDLGEYAISVPAGVYRVEIRTARGLTHRSKIDVSIAGSYRNLLSVPSAKEREN